MLGRDAGQKQNAKADKRCLSLIGGEWDAFLAKMQMQVGKAPILAQTQPLQHPSTKEHFYVCDSRSNNTLSRLIPIPVPQ